MSHLFETGFFVSQPAWHGLGKVLDNPPTIEQAIIDAGLDWEVLEENVYDLKDDGSPVAIPNYKQLKRSSDRKTLGIVSTQYHPLQNLKAFQWFNFLLHEGSASLEAAGALKGGKRIWVLARVNQDELEVKDGDTVKPYLLLSNSHDGTSAVWIQFTVIRTVCWNTLSAALSSRYEQERQKTAIRIRHSASLDEQLTIASHALDFARQQFTQSIAEYRAIAKQQIDKERFEVYVAKVLQVDDPLAIRAFDQIKANFLEGRGNQGETLWDAYNGVTEWIDHQRGRSTATRLESAWFGDGSRLRTRAHEVALDLL